jgi:hypothetical protein
MRFLGEIFLLMSVKVLEVGGVEIIGLHNSLKIRAQSPNF